MTEPAVRPIGVITWAEAAGRDPDEIRIACYVRTCVTQTPEVVEQACREQLARYGSMTYYQHYFRSIGFTDEADLMTQAWKRGDRDAAVDAVTLPMIRATMATILEAEHLVKHFGGVKAIDDVGLRLEQGGIRGVIGPNGSGKTTLVNVLSGYYGLDGGTIRLHGTPIDTFPPYQRLALGLMRTFQVPKLFDDMTVYENLLVPALSDSQIGRWSHAEVQALAEQSLAFSQLSPVRHLLAKEIISEPKLMLVDEPSAGLAPRITHHVYEFLEASRQSGVTILLVDQNINEAVKASDYISNGQNSSQP